MTNPQEYNRNWQFTRGSILANEHGAAQWWSVFFIVMGWILATAVVLSLTGLLKRD